MELEFKVKLLEKQKSFLERHFFLENKKALEVVSMIPGMRKSNIRLRNKFDQVWVSDIAYSVIHEKPFDLRIITDACLNKIRDYYVWFLTIGTQ